MNTFPDFAERFKDLISENGLSQKQIACAIGIPETSVSNYISGKSEPSLKVLVAIADYFKCTTDYITGKKDESEEKIFLPCPPFSTQLKILMDKKPCSGYRLCTDANIPQASFYDWKNGKTEPNLYNVKKLLEYFDCSLDFLLGREA